MHVFVLSVMPCVVKKTLGMLYRLSCYFKRISLLQCLDTLSFDLNN